MRHGQLTPVKRSAPSRVMHRRARPLRFPSAPLYPFAKWATHHSFSSPARENKGQSESNHELIVGWYQPEEGGEALADFSMPDSEPTPWRPMVCLGSATASQAGD